MRNIQINRASGLTATRVWCIQYSESHIKPPRHLPGLPPPALPFVSYWRFVPILWRERQIAVRNLT